MKGAPVAVLLVSNHFLASDFCMNEEVPYLLEREEREGLVLPPVLVRHSLGAGALDRAPAAPQPRPAPEPSE